MLWANLRRGLAAGAVAGMLAGVLGVLVGAPTIETAESLAHAEEAGHAEQGGHAGEADHGGEDSESHEEAAPAVTRRQQRWGLVGGTTLAGLALGAMLGLASGPAAGRLRGDAWARTWKLGGAVTAAVVVLPALRYPPVPPGGADPETVGTRTALYVAVVLLGLAVVLGAVGLQRLLSRAGLVPAVRHTLTAAAAMVAVGAAFAAMPSSSAVGASASGFPAELVWTFRLESVATQLVLWLGVTTAFGLLATRAERGGLRQPAVSPVTAGG